MHTHTHTAQAYTELYFFTLYPLMQDYMYARMRIQKFLPHPTLHILTHITTSCFCHSLLSCTQLSLYTFPLHHTHTLQHRVSASLLSCTHLSLYTSPLHHPTSHLLQGCMSSVLDFFLEGPWEDSVLSPGLAPPNLPMRSAMLMTPSDVRELVSTVH